MFLFTIFASIRLFFLGRGSEEAQAISHFFDLGVLSDIVTMVRNKGSRQVGGVKGRKDNAEYRSFVRTESAERAPIPASFLSFSEKTKLRIKNKDACARLLAACCQERQPAGGGQISRGVLVWPIMAAKRPLTGKCIDFVSMAFISSTLHVVLSFLSFCL